MNYIELLKEKSNKMKTITKLPDLAKAFDLCIIAIDLEGMEARSSYQIGIVQAIKEGEVEAVIHELKQVGNENRPLLWDIVGKKLAAKIMNY